MHLGPVKGALHIIGNGMNASRCLELGFTNDAYKELISQTPWTYTQRPSVRATLESLCHVTTELVGLPRIKIPAEYVACVISVFVHPVNVAVACSWMSGQLPHARDLAQVGDEAPQGMDHLNASQLFALVLEIIGNEDTGAVARQFHKRMFKRVEEVTPSA